MPVTASAARNLSWFARCRSALGPDCRVPIAGPEASGFLPPGLPSAASVPRTGRRMPRRPSSSGDADVKMTPDFSDALLMIPVLANAARNDSCCSWRRSLLVTVIALENTNVSKKRQTLVFYLAIRSYVRDLKSLENAAVDVAVTTRRSERASRFRGLLRFAIHADRTVSQPATRADDAFDAGLRRLPTYSLYTAAGIAAARDSPRGGGVPRTVGLFTGSRRTGPP